MDSIKCSKFLGYGHKQIVCPNMEATTLEEIQKVEAQVPEVPLALETLKGENFEIQFVQNDLKEPLVDVGKVLMKETVLQIVLEAILSSLELIEHEDLKVQSVHNDLENIIIQADDVDLLRDNEIAATPCKEEVLEYAHETSHVYVSCIVSSLFPSSLELFQPHEEKNSKTKRQGDVLCFEI